MKQANTLWKNFSERTRSSTVTEVKASELESPQLLLQVHFMGTVCCVICYSILKQRFRKKTNT